MTIMKKFENMELIENHLSGKDFRIAGIGKNGGYQMKKIYLKEKENTTHTWVQRLFPGAQIVHDIQDITKDNCIELIIIPDRAKDFATLAKIIHTGKHVRIV
jgi:hypothetical protein